MPCGPHAACALPIFNIVERPRRWRRPSVGSSGAVPRLAKAATMYQAEVIDEPPHGGMRPGGVDGEFAPHSSLCHVRMTPPARSLRSSTQTRTSVVLPQRYAAVKPDSLRPRPPHALRRPGRIDQQGPAKFPPVAIHAPVLHGSHPLARRLRTSSKAASAEPSSGV